MITPSKENNQFKIDHAFPGLCSYCHSEVANFNGSKEVAPGIFRPIITSLRPNYRESVFELNDGTKMVIVLCDKCDDDIEPQHMDALMESEINGWQREVDDFCPEWPEEKKLNYMTDYSGKFVKDRKSRPWTQAQIARLTKPRADKLKIKTRKKEK